MTALAVAAVVAALAVLFVALRRGELARIAVRSAARRKGETVLVILGSLLGTAIITGSFLVGDTLGASLRLGAEQSLGPTDLVVRSGDPTAGAAAAAALEGFTSPDIDGVLPVTVSFGAVATPGEKDRLATPGGRLVELDFADGAAFGDDPATTGISGTTPGPGHAVINQPLADDLQVEAGDTVVVYAYGQEVELTVDAVLERTGLAGLAIPRDPSLLEHPRNVFVAPGTVDDLIADAPPAAAQAQPPTRLVLVSATGGVYDSVERTAAVEEQLTAALEDVARVEIDPVKQDLLDSADEQGDAFREVFIAIGSFAVMAGILLLVNIFVMLAEDRKSELGMLRAVGLKRRDLVRIFLIEGSLYAVAAAVLGALLGILVGRVIVLVTSGIFESFGDVSLTFSAPTSSIVTGGLIGFLISMATIVATSFRNSRLNIIRAIRDLPEPTVRHRRPWVLGVQVLGLVLFSAGAASSIATEEPMGSLAFPGLAGLSLALVLGHWLPRRFVVSVISLAVLLWTIFASEIVEFAGGDINVFIVQGVVLTAAAVALVGQNQESIGAVIKRLGADTSLVARLGLAYPLARRFRTSMTLAMYSLVIFTLVFISVLSSIFGALTDEIVEDEGGGYDILATASPTNPVAAEDLEGTPGVADVGVMPVGQALYRVGTDGEFRPWGIGGITPEFLDGGAPGLRDWNDAYAEESDVWNALLADPSLMVADAFFLQVGGGPPENTVAVGDTVFVRDPATGETVERTVAAVADAGQSITAWMSQESAEDAVAQLAPTRAYISVEDGANPTEVAVRLQGQFIANGLRADSFRDIAVEQTRANAQFFRLMQGFLALGLVVGIAGLGVIMVRAVHERRRQIGMLRSLGFQSRSVRAAFLLESGFVALEGMFVGTALSLITAYQIVVKSDFFGDIDVPFAVPWGQLALLLGVSLFASLVATAWPANQAARIKPAVALRIAD